MGMDSSSLDAKPVGVEIAPSGPSVFAQGRKSQKRLSMPRGSFRKDGLTHLNPLTLLSRAAGMFALEGASVGLFLWEMQRGEELDKFIHANTISPALRRVLLTHMGFGVGLFFILGLALLIWKTRSAPLTLVRMSMRLAPLSLTAFIPLLFDWKLWDGHDLPYLALVSLVALGAQRVVTQFFSAGLPEDPHPAFYLARERHPARHLLAKISRSASGWLPILIVVGFFIWYSAFFSYYTVLNHRSLRTASFDLGLENNIIWNALHGGKLEISSPLGGPGCSHLGFHATFFSYVIALFYAFYQDPETLLVFQSVMIAAAAFPLFFYARRHIGPWAASLVACAYLLYAPVHGSNLYDFHYPPLSALFLWSTLFFVDSGRYKLAAIAVLLSLSVREDVSFGVVIIGAFFILTNQKPKQGLVLALVGVSYFALMKFVVMPRALGGDSAFTYVYKNLLPAGDSGFGGILKTIFGNPAYTLSTLLEKNKLVYFLQIMSPMAFLPLRVPIGWLLIVPGFLFTLLSTGYAPVIQISFQYTAHWTVYLFIAIVVGLAWLGRAHFPGDRCGPVRKKAWLAAIALALLSNSYQHGALIQQNTARGGFGRYTFTRSAADVSNYQALYSLIRKVPPLAKIASTESIVPHVSSRPDSYTMRVGIFDAEYLLFPDAVSRDEWVNFEAALTKGVYGIIDQAGPFYLAKRGAPAHRNPEVIKRLSH
jgi:uncharacterized membrane protein